MKNIGIVKKFDLDACRNFAERATNDPDSIKKEKEIVHRMVQEAVENKELVLESIFYSNKQYQFISGCRRLHCFLDKNPINMMSRLDELSDYNYFFQFTLTGYGKDIEPGLPDKRTVLIPVFQQLSKKIGKERMVWRYDPILINDRYNVEYHIKAFREIAEKLSGYTEKVVISFFDLYENTRKNTAHLHLQPGTSQNMINLAKRMAEIAQKNHLQIETCAEKINLQQFGIQHGSCIDKKQIEKVIGCRLSGKKDPNQRAECGCMESIDIGAYNTCLNGCKYCYANYNHDFVKSKRSLYDPKSPLLCDTFSPGDRISEREMKSLKDLQLSFWG